jgi:hypothetical protein
MHAVETRHKETWNDPPATDCQLPSTIMTRVVTRARASHYDLPCVKVLCKQCIGMVVSCNTCICTARKASDPKNEGDNAYD